MKTKREILELIEDEDIKFVRLQFTDMFGNLKNVAVTAGQMERVLKNRYTIASDTLFDGFPYGEEDLYLHPDLDTFVILPWRPQHDRVARLLCDVRREDGSEYELSPRSILKHVVERAQSLGYTFYVDPDCEFFMFHTDDNGIPTTITHERAGLMDVGPMDRGENPRRDIVLALEEMGFEVESSHHESAPAQHEIDFKEAEPLTIADSVVTLKSAVKSLAGRFGLHATFMPKPKKGIPGSGFHLNISVYKDGRNLLNEHGPNREIRQEAKWFIGGIMEHIDAICAITNPLVNSYKRLMSGFDAPQNKMWTTKNKNALVKLRRRAGEDTKVDLRFPDPSANPYLAIAVCLAAGVDGLERQLDPGEEAVSYGQLPGTLREAVLCMQGDAFVEEALGREFAGLYTEAKMREWNEYMEQVSDWELRTYLYKM